VTLHRLLTINVPISIGFGVGCVVFPNELMAVYDVDLSAAGVAMTQLAGAAFFGWGTLAFLARSGSPEFMRGAAIGLFVQDGVATVASTLSQVGGPFNWLGWTTPIVYGLLAVGYGYFLVVGSGRRRRNR
jgi:hypothetical protein